jgi:hypothetical protein
MNINRGRCVAVTFGAAFAAALIGLANAPVAGAEGSAVDTAFDNFLQGIANIFAPEVPEDSLFDPDAFCGTLLSCYEPPSDQMLDAFYLTVNTAFQPEGPIDAFFDQLLGDSAPAATLDMQVSIDGTDLFPTAGNTATATSDMGDIAIAIGNGAEANATDATGSSGDFAFADGANSLAEAGFNDPYGGNDSAWVFGANSTAEAGFIGSGDTAVVFGANSTADAGFGEQPSQFFPFGFPNDSDLAAAFGDMLHAVATSGSGLVDIVPSL